MDKPIVRTTAWVGLLLLAMFGVAHADEASMPGSLMTRLEDGSYRELPLQHTDVRVEISAFVARTHVEQVFHNPFDLPIEAVYIFPLGDRAAVDDFEMRSGDRVIRGVIQPREEARRTYETARQAGYQAALLEQQRPNVFLQSIANLMPGEEIRIRLRTVELLDYTDGVYQYVFPLVVGERYISGDDSKTSIDAAKLNPPVLGPGERSRHDAEIHVELDAGVPISDIVSPNQTVYVTQTGPTTAEIDLAEVSRVPDKDFVLRWNVSANRPATGVLAHRTGVDGYFALLVQPKGRIEVEEAAAKEVVLVLDTSGSMSGVPIETSKAFVGQALTTLGRRDTFNIVRFAGDAAVFSRDSLPNTAENVRRALEWVRDFQGHGGTEMLGGLRKVLERTVEPGRFRQVVFLTDGYIGTEDLMVAAVRRLPDQYRVFTIGIGGSVNHSLLRRMAEVGDGAYTFIPDDSDRWNALERFRRWVTRPYLTDLEVDWGALPLLDLVPKQPRDLFSGQNLYVIGKYVGSGEGIIKLRGYLAGSYWEQEVLVTLPDHRETHEALASVWARHRIEELMLGAVDEMSAEVRERVTELAVEHRLMSRFTSFVAVDDSMTVNPGGECAAVQQAVAHPAGIARGGSDEAMPAVRVLHSATAMPATNERVKVTAAGNVVDLEKTTTSTRFSDEFIQDLPVPGRFYQNVLTLAPGVQDTDGDGDPNVHASRERDFRAVVNGVSNVDPLSGGFISAVNPNSIEQMQVVTAGAGVEFGRAQGGFARIVPTQGSNDFRGEIELLARSGKLDGIGANRPGVPGYDGLRGGAAVSGPIVKDRLWYRLSHNWLDREVPVDTTAGFSLVPVRGSTHNDRLTWQVSPRNKLGFELSVDRFSRGNIGVGSWTGPESTHTEDDRGSSYALNWVAPYSPRVLFETSAIYQDRRFELGPNFPGEQNDCVPGADSLIQDAWCLDLVGHRISGSAYRSLADHRRRITLSSQASIYAGRFLGGSHQLRLGVAIDGERYSRSLTRGASLIRTPDGAGNAILVARVAPRPTNHASSTATYWYAFAEDQFKPFERLVFTLGLRVDDVELRGEGFQPLDISDTQVSPFAGVSWDPWANGKTKFSFSARRYYGELDPALALIEAEPATIDLELVDPTTDELPIDYDGFPVNIQTVARDLETPYQDEWTLGFEREIAVETRLGLTYIDRRYRNQLGYVDANRSFGGDPRWGEILHVDNFHSMTHQAWVLEVIRRQYRSWEMAGSYTWSESLGDADEFDLLEGDERSRIEDRPGYRPADQRHMLKLNATTITALGFRLGGSLRWESGLPYSVLEPSLIRQAGGREPRLIYTTGRRNDQRNPSQWTLDAKIVRDLNLGRGLNLQLVVELFNLLDDKTYRVFNDARGFGLQIDGVNDATRRYGRHYTLGARLQF